jgi:hypothetical protein
MNGTYRDERDAAMAARDALHRENAELRARLAQSEQTRQHMEAAHQQQLAMAQRGVAPAVPLGAAPRGALALGLALGAGTVLLVAGILAALILRSPSPPPVEEPVRLGPGPTGLRSDGLPHGYGRARPSPPASESANGP